MFLMLPLDIRLSKAQVMAIAHNLHHDECGIEAMFTAMKQADNPRVAYNAAWVLSHLSKEDKRIYPALRGIGRYGNICRALFPPWADTDYSYRYANG